ncbi:MAG: methyltransferase domain-containing protein [Roseovarius sp.]
MAVPALVSVLPQGADVLDLCCGQGNVAAAASAAGCCVTGLDFSAQMLAIARERVPEVEFVEGDAQALPFEDKSFEAVTCGFGLMHVPDQEKALREIARVLRPGGVFAMTSWCGPARSPVFAAFYGIVRAHGAADVSLPDSPDFHQFTEAETAAKLFAQAGLRFEGVTDVPCFWLLRQPEELAEIFEKGAPRAGYLLSHQPEAHRLAIKSALADHVRAHFADGSGFRAPIPAALAVARKA